MTYDSIIIGAGPAGSHLGYLLANAGFNVAILDQKSFPREKLCGGLLTAKALALLPESLIADVPKFSIKSASVFYKNELTGSIPMLSNLRTVRRRDFDDSLLRAATEAGCVAYLGLRLTHLNYDENELTLSDGRTLKYRNLFGADGALSTVRRLIKLPRNTLGFCMEAHVPVDALQNQYVVQNNSVEIYYGEQGKGYGWVFPTPDSIAIGVGNIASDLTEKQIVSTYYTFASKILSENDIKAYAAYLPSGDSVLLGAPNCENICLLGDAAGLIDPFTGEGIYYAILSAKKAYRAMTESRRPSILLNYEQLMTPTIIEMQNNVRIRNKLYSPIALKTAISSMQSALQYSAELIDDTIVNYNKAYSEAYEEFQRLTR